jgi:hypothetical protein
LRTTTCFTTKNTTTRPTLLDNYKDQRGKYSDLEFKEFLKKYWWLITAAPDQSVQLAKVLIDGKKQVVDGEYAVELTQTPFRA